MPSRDPTSHSGPETRHSEYRRYCARFEEERSAERVEEMLRQAGSRDLTDDFLWTDEFWDRVLADVSARSPFSFVRLGDGEGNALMWRDRRGEFPVLAEYCVRAIWKVMFGAWPADERLFGILSDGVADAAAGADYLGIPWRADIDWGLSEGHRETDLDSSPVDVRGVGGYLPVWDHLAWRMPADWLGRATLTFRHVHHSLVTRWIGLVQAAGNLSLVSCYGGLLERMHAVAGVRYGEEIPIPPQASNVRETPAESHFPRRYEEIDAGFSGRDLSGRLFFVAAGVAGKHYCRQIKAQGGMAVDAGSTVDVWAGKLVRPYQTPEHVSRYAL